MATETKLNELAALGLQYIQWGSRLFIVGLVLQLVPLLHYTLGTGGPLSPEFLEKIILWFGCPGEMAAQIVLVGGLSLFAFGFCYSFISRFSERAVTGKERFALFSCVSGLIAVVLSGIGLYPILNSTAGGDFYFNLIEPERTIWLFAQLISFIVYFAGTLLALGSIKGDVKPLLEGA